MKPIIGILAEVEDNRYSGVRNAYVSAIECAGGLPLLIPYVTDEATISEYVSLSDGIFFTGGADIDPSIYGEMPSPDLGKLQKRRDELEIRIFSEAIKTRVPILGICRGMQMINAALGGTLFQDIPTEYDTPIKHKQIEGDFEPSHSVNITEGTPLAALVEKKRMCANSFHHQAIKTLGAGLHVSAHADDGMIEAVYLDEERYLRAYQWHPERLNKTDSDNRKIFEDFISAAKEYKAVR